MFAKRIGCGFGCTGVGFGEDFLGLRDLVGARRADPREQVVDRLVERRVTRDHRTLFSDLVGDLLDDRDRDDLLDDDVVDDHLFDHDDDLGIRLRLPVRARAA